MAENALGQFYIPSVATGLSGSYTVGRVVKMFWDDVALSVKVYLYESDGTLVGLQGSGPTISYPVDDANRYRLNYEKFQVINYGYKYCDGTTLKSFFVPNAATQPNPFVYPYVRTVTQADHWSCAVNICDIAFNLQATSIVEDSGASDGQITVVGTSSISAVKFTLDSEAVYADALGTGSTYTFTNLAAGTYTIYALDSAQCRVQITVIVPEAAATYSTRWRLEYTDIKQESPSTTRVDIEEKEYAGSITEVIAAENPVILSWRGESVENVFTQVIESTLELNLVSETDLQFFDLFTQDERKFRIKMYKDTGDGFELKWQGFVLPMLYSEPYFIDHDYDVMITASDQIGTFKDLGFTDDFGNILNDRISVLDAICIILRKTDIDLDVYEAVNIFEQNMDTAASDSPLKQAYIDPEVYLDGNEPQKCIDVLNFMLSSFGARLYQAEGMWRIEMIENKATTVSYRVFDINGDYVSNGSIDSLMTIKAAGTGPRVTPTGMSAVISILPSYNKIRFLVDTKLKNNLLTSGSFEEYDLIDNNRFRGWGFDLTNGTGIDYGIEKLTEPRGDSESALFVDFSNTASGANIVILAEEFTLQPINGLSLKLKFDILFRPYYKEFFSYVDVSLKIDTRYLKGNQNFATVSTDTASLIDGEYIRIYVDDNLKWNTIERAVSSAIPGGANFEISGPVVLKIRASNNQAYDYASLTALRAAPTDSSYTVNNLNRVRVKDGTQLRIYNLEASPGADSAPDYIRPDDYVGYRWVLKATYDIPDDDYFLNGVLLDNVELSIQTNFEFQATVRGSRFGYVPSSDGEDISKEIKVTVYEQSFNPDIKLDLEKGLIHTDYTVTDAAGVDDENYLRLTKSYISLPDGTATTLWSRSYSTESKSLIDVLMAMYQAQVTSPSFKLSGNFETDTYPSFFNYFYESRLEKYFIPIFIAWNDRMNTFDAEFLELKTDSGGDPGIVYEFTEEFTTEFDA